MSELGEGTAQPGAMPHGSAPAGTPDSIVAAIAARVSPSVRVAALSVLLVSIASFLFFTLLWHHARPVLPPGVAIPWPLMAVAFFVAEMRVIDVSFRREKHSFSLSEFPAVVSFFLLSPTEYFLAMLVGTGVALLWTRHRALKFAYNLSNWALVGSVALTIFYMLYRPGTVPDPLAWVAAFAATAAAAIVSAASIATAISLSGGAPQFQKLPEMIQFGLLVAVANTSLALLAVGILWSHPEQLALLGVPLVTVFLAYRAYQSEREKHERLDLLYQSSRILQHSPALESAVAALLEHTREMFRSERAELMLWPRAAGEDGLLTTAVHDGTPTTMEPIADHAVNLLHHRAANEDGPFLYAGPPGAIPGVRQAMAAPLAGESGMIGSILVVNRLAETATFDEDDLRLLETIANQAAVALQNGQLEQSLSELSRLKEELRHQAYHDPLTGLANRMLFSEQVRGALGTATDELVPVVLFVDLDDFKVVNDSLGHASGDQLLLAVAERVRTSIRADDLAARLGGDEFAILLMDDRRLERALAVATRVIDALAVTVPVNGRNLKVSASIGIAAAQGPETNAEELLRNADVAMYTAKQGGKNSFAVFEPTMHASIVRRHAFTTDLSRGIAEGEMTVFFQPLISLTTGQPYGAEALARWNHPTRGIVSPTEFIRLAEESGAILPLGRSVLRDACRHAASWPAQQGRPSVVSVNVSAAQLRRADFVEEVIETLRETGLPPSALILEMTETVMFHDTEATIDRLTALRSMGVRVAIDDFGTGYSSLGYLRQFPVDILKIAREFVPVVEHVEGEWVFASAIVALGRTLGLRIVAEGIETRPQLVRLRQMGCEFGQGYLFARPMPAPDFTEYLASAAAGGLVPGDVGNTVPIARGA